MYDGDMNDVAVDSLYGFEMKRKDKRRADPGERKSHDIGMLWQRNHEILRLAIVGLKSTEIAEILGIHKQTVSNTINSDLGKQKLSTMRKERDESAIDVVKEVAKMYPKALSIYNRILDGDDVTKMQKDTADTVVMDIGGHRAPAKTQSQGGFLHMTPADIESFKKRGIEAAKISGLIVDAEFREVKDE